MATKDEQQRQLMSNLGLDPNASYTPGLSGMGGPSAVYTPITGVALGSSGTPVGYKPESSGGDENKFRVGDYTQTATGWKLVENSPTDIVQKYITSDALPKQGFSISDLFSAGKNAAMAFSGLPTESNNIGEAIGSAVVGQLLRGNPITRLIWTGGNFLDSIVNSEQKRLDEYLNQDFNYDVAGDFYTDENGKMGFHVNYSKMEGVGSESGSAVRTAQETDTTGASMNEDNKLKINVTPVFAQSDSYRNLLSAIKDTYDGMTTDSANEIVDQDTGKTRIDTISDLVKAAESNFLYNASVVKDIKSKAPTASDKSLNIAVETSKIGYLSEKILAETEVQIYDDKNNLVEVNAKDYLDSISKMSKLERNDYMSRIGNRISDNNISDDEKAVLYAQATALYAASESGDGDYKGMYQKDLLDTIGSTGGIVTGLPLNTFFGGKELDTFRDNELYSGALDIGTSLASIKALTALTNANEKLIRKFTPKMSTWAGESLRGVLSTSFKPGSSVVGELAKVAGKTGLQVAYQLAADAVYDTAKLLPYALSGNIDKYDYLGELGTDFAMDMLVTYGPGQFAGAMRSPKTEYRVAAEDQRLATKLENIVNKKGATRESIIEDLRKNFSSQTKDQDLSKMSDEGLRDFVDTLAVEYKRPKDIKGDSNYKILQDETGTRDSKLIDVTSNELAQRRAAVIDKLTDTKVGIRMQELWFDKNAAMGKLAVQVRKVANRYMYQKMLRYAGDVNQITTDTLAEFRSKEDVARSYETMQKAFREAGASLKDFSQADWDYINAKANERRFLGKHSGDKDMQRKVREFYKDGISGVSNDRAAQLDNVISGMAGVASHVFDFYVEKGLMTQDQVNELRAQPGYEEGLYIPIYTTSGSGVGGEISQNRMLYKQVRAGDALIALKDLDNPMNSLARYVHNAMRAVAINDRALAIRDAASLAGVGIHIVDDTGNSLKEVKNLRSFDEAFDKIFKAIAARTRSELPTFKQWQETNDKLVMRSNALKSAQKVDELQTEAKRLRNENRRLQRQMKKATDPSDTEKIFEKIQENRSLIVDNKQQQLMYVDDMKRYAKNLMERAQKAHKGSNVKLDIDSYLNIQVTNGLKDALKSSGMVGKVQDVLNKAVERANPFVDPKTVIKSRTEAAAIKYRKDVQKKISDQLKDSKNKRGVGIDKINSLTDKVMDRIMRKLTGERPTEVTFIDEDGMPTKLLDNHGQKNVIRYMLDGKEQRFTLEGNGAEALVAEFYAPEFVAPTSNLQKARNTLRKVGNKLAQGKRYLTTAWNWMRMPMNVARDWSRGIVTTGGQIMLSPDKFFGELAQSYGYTPEDLTKINNGLMLAREAIDTSTFTASMMMPSKNAYKDMVRAMLEPDGNGFVRFVYDIKAKDFGKALSAVQDAGESFTRKHAMDTAYYRELSDSQARGLSMDESIKNAVEAAYFSGREATTNFYRRGEYVAKIAQQVPYLTQKFASLKSLEYAYLDDPVGMTRALETTVSAYTALIAVALSNEESRKKYFLLSEYDRANNILIPLNNDTIMTIPLDENIAAFLTPYRRMVESLNGLDPEAFYLCFAEALGALSPVDLSGFSEGDGFNVVRGFEKLGSEFIPTWAQPFIEATLGRDLYYGSTISVDEDYTGALFDNWTPTPGELTKQGKNSQTLALISDHTGIPQWILQNFVSEYGGSISEYLLNTIDKISGATEKAQGGREWSDVIFKAFTGSDSNQASNAFYEAISSLKNDKKKLQNEIKTLTAKINGAAYNEKAELIKERQKKITEYGLHVTDVLNQYLSAFEITGGLSKSQANQAWYLYKLYDEQSNQDMYIENTTGDYFTDKAKAWNNKQTTSLAAGSGLDSIVRSPVNAYYDTYAEQAFKQTSYGDTYNYIANIEDLLNTNGINRSNMFKDYNNMTSAQKKAWKSAWNMKVVKAIAPYIQEVGVDNLLEQRKVVDYLDEVIFVSNPWNTKQYLKQIFGGQ